jgi:hypothetical protein
MGQDERTRRIGLNEALFRKVNETVHELDLDEEREMLCECGDESCTARIRISSEAYEQVRSDPAQFVVVHGHSAPDVESVLARTDGYEIVRKRAGPAQEIAEETDPR